MKTCVCKIENNNNSGTGFFCKIPHPNLSCQIPVLITSYKVIGKKELIRESAIKLIFFDKSSKIKKLKSIGKYIQITNTKII